MLLTSAQRDKDFLRGMGQIDEQDVDIVSESSEKPNDKSIKVDSDIQSAAAKINNYTD